MMTFSEALDHVKNGLNVARSGWNGKKVFLCTRAKVYPELTFFEPFLAVRTADGKFVPWVVSQSDVLAEDWDVVE